MRQRFLIFAVLGAVLVGIGEWNHRAGNNKTFSGLNDLWLEFCIGNAGDRIAHPAVTVVRIDDSYEPLTIGEGEAAPDGTLSRLDYATILGFVAKLNPKSVAFLPTPSFDESRVLNQTDIVPLKDAALQLPRMQVATIVSDDGEGAKEATPVEYPTVQLEGDPESILTFTRTVQSADSQIAANGDPAFKSIETARNLSGGGVVRIPLVARHGEKIVPSIVLSAVANHAGIANDQIVVDLTTAEPVIRLGENVEVPIGADGTMELPAHAGMKRTMTHVRRAEDGTASSHYGFTTLKVEELAYTGNEDDEVAKRIIEEANLKGQFDSIAENLVVIGFDRTADRRIITATGEVLSQTMAFSQAMATIQSGRFIGQWPIWARILSALVIFAIAFVLFHFSKGKLAAGWLIAVLLYFGVCVMIFRATLLWTPPFVAFALFALMLVIGLLISRRSGSVEKTDEAA